MARTTTTPSRGVKRSSPRRQARSARAAPSPKAADAAPPEVKIMLTHDQIAQRAYAIWVAKGRPMGLDAQNWAEAEAELRSAAASQ